MAKHRADYKTYIIKRIKKTTSVDIFYEFGVNNCKIELVELYPCNSRDELKQREGHHLKNTECVNKCSR